MGASQWVDIITIGVALVFTMLGALRGLLPEIFSMLGIFLGIVFVGQWGMAWSRDLQNTLSSSGLNQTSAQLYTEYGILLICFLLVGFLAPAALVRYRTPLTGNLRIAGGVLGLLNASLVMTWLLKFLSDISTSGADIVNKSAIGSFLVSRWINWSLLVAVGGILLFTILAAAFRSFRVLTGPDGQALLGQPAARPPISPYLIPPQQTSYPPAQANLYPPPNNNMATRMNAAPPYQQSPYQRPTPPPSAYPPPTSSPVYPPPPPSSYTPPVYTSTPAASGPLPGYVPPPAASYPPVSPRQPEPALRPEPIRPASQPYVPPVTPPVAPLVEPAPRTANEFTRVDMDAAPTPVAEDAAALLERRIQPSRRTRQTGELEPREPLTPAPEVTLSSEPSVAERDATQVIAEDVPPGQATRFEMGDDSETRIIPPDQR